MPAAAQPALGTAYVLERKLGAPDDWGLRVRLALPDRTTSIVSWLASDALSGDTLAIGTGVPYERARGPRRHGERSRRVAHGTVVLRRQRSEGEALAAAPNSIVVYE